MGKLTSKDIDWRDGMYCAVVCRGSAGTVYFQYSGDTEGVELANDCYVVKRDPTFKQAIVDAVNHYHGSALADRVIFKDGKWHSCDFGEWIEYSVCTRDEFNQCVKDMSNHAGSELFERYVRVKKQTLEQVEKPLAWVNGDECRYTHDINHEYIYIGSHPHGDGHYVFSETKGITYISNGYLVEPLTAEQKEEREDKARSLWELRQSFIEDVNLDWNDPIEEVREIYRKMIDAGVKLP